jgi:hypothetical protein
MNKPHSKAFDKTVSVTMAVILMSTLTGFIQKSNAADLEKVAKVQRLSRAAKLAAVIEQQKVNIRALKILQLESQTERFSDQDLADLMEAVGFEGTAVRQAWAVAKKETHGNPRAYNNNPSTGDLSYGVFQINMLGGMGADRRMKYDLRTNNDLFNPVTNARIAFQMTDGGKDWSSWKVGQGYNGGDEQSYREWYAKFPGGAA